MFRLPELFMDNLFILLTPIRGIETYKYGGCGLVYLTSLIFRSFFLGNRSIFHVDHIKKERSNIYI